MGQGKERKGKEGLLREVHPVHVLPSLFPSVALHIPKGAPFTLESW